ncbi:hypothetical protein [Metamycoplasma arthritidis]|nr:hypothetical protein [Metamycoplasma arthritidis]
MFFIFRYATKLRWIDALTIVIVTCATINFFILIFRWGFAKGIINRIKEYFAERTIRRKARKSFSSDMTEHQKAQILIKERQKAQQAWIEKEKKSQNTTNNLTFYLLLLLDLVALVAMIPFLIK